MKNALVRAFAEANVPAELAPAPLQDVSASIFQMDIERGDHERLRVWPGASENVVRVLDGSRPHAQVVLFVLEPSRAFERKIPKHGAATLPSGNFRIIRETEYNWIAEYRTPSAERRFLCGRDESHLFVAQLREGDTVAEAHETLKPEAVRRAERDGLPVRRQGEWFFIPVAPMRALRRLSRLRLNADIEVGTPRPHRAAELTMYEGNVFARGEVRHADHRTLTLSGWHLVVRNTEVVDPERRRGILWID